MILVTKDRTGFIQVNPDTEFYMWVKDKGYRECTVWFCFSRSGTDIKMGVYNGIEEAEKAIARAYSGLAKKTNIIYL